MPKVLQINVCNNVYSTGKIASEIGDEAINEGWESYIAYGRSCAPNRSEAIRIGTSIDINIHAIEQRIFDNTGLGFCSSTATRQLVEKIKQIRPNIIHLHVLVGYYINLKVLFKYLATSGIPVVWTLHSCWEFTGHCTHFDYQGCNKWIEGCHHCPIKNEYPKSYLFDRSRKNYEEKKRLFTSVPNLHIVAVSEWLSNNVSRSFLQSFPCTVINNGIDVSIYKPSQNSEYLRDKYNLRNCSIALGVASAWTKKKGFEDYIRLSSILPENVKIVMVGLSKDQIKSLPATIIGIERTTNRQELVDWYSLASVVLNLSYEESFGLTTVEGYACGTPSIVYNKTASPELIKEGIGYVVNAGDIQSVRDRINQIVDCGKEQFARRCRKVAEEAYDKDKNYKEYIELYNKILSVQ